MALFKCIKTHTEAHVIERIQRRAANDTVSVVEVDRRVIITPGAYGHENIKVGEVYEISGRLADKARANTEYFSEVKDVSEVAEVPETAEKTEGPKKRGRPKKEVTDNDSNSGGDSQQSAQKTG